MGSFPKQTLLHADWGECVDEEAAAVSLCADASGCRGAVCASDLDHMYSFFSVPPLNRVPGCNMSAFKLLFLCSTHTPAPTRTDSAHTHTVFLRLYRRILLCHASLTARSHAAEHKTTSRAGASIYINSLTPTCKKKQRKHSHPRVSSPWSPPLVPPSLSRPPASSFSPEPHASQIRTEVNILQPPHAESPSATANDPSRSK